MADRITGDTFKAEVIEGTLPTIVDFYSDTCVPCKRMNPIIAKLEPAYEGRVRFVKVNVSFDMELAAAAGVMGSPTFILYKGGKELARHQGVMKADELTAFADQAL